MPISPGLPVRNGSPFSTWRGEAGADCQEEDGVHAPRSSLLAPRPRPAGYASACGVDDRSAAIDAWTAIYTVPFELLPDKRHVSSGRDAARPSLVRQRLA